MEVFIPVLISVTATLGLIALGVGWIVMAPLSSHTDDQGVAQGMNLHTGVVKAPLCNLQACFPALFESR